MGDSAVGDDPYRTFALRGRGLKIACFCGQVELIGYMICGKRVPKF